MPSAEKTKEDIERFLVSFQEALQFWSNSVKSQLSNKSNDKKTISTTNNTTTTDKASEEGLLASSKLETPVLELPKLAKLLNMHATKIGLVFKPPLDPSSHTARYTELENASKTMILLYSLLSQLINEKETYSSLFVGQCVEVCRGLTTNFISLSSEVAILMNNTIEETEDKEAEEQEQEQEQEGKDRLISIAKIWESCDSIQNLVKLGSAGILKGKLKGANQLVNDALEEFEEWVEDPTSGFNDDDDDDPFQLNRGFDEPTTKDNNTDDEDEDEVDEELLKFAKIWVQKVKLIKLLLTSLDKSIPANKYTTKFSSRVDLLNSYQSSISEVLDDVVGSIIYEQDLEAAIESSEKLKTVCSKIVTSVKELNNSDPKRCKWLDTWQVKFLESK
ncbi:hypothetical protein CANARDRAFT_28868 [[Candida] arabinofermentans NRRL YB-2248]|uniref:Cyclin-D1-binding protein 1-like N-terminal domain-containing protein n=1 Tax=[Candida] arabinofermentans NRRL YB-2248 TaxID=983967 RepID=A0A1E4SZ34_9ASCO|nr:hypothetical protein CANARDRAFT_28868 [[Candida] arabinofermentans NRRL YB-2248]